MLLILQLLKHGTLKLSVTVILSDKVKMISLMDGPLKKPSTQCKTSSTKIRLNLTASDFAKPMPTMEPSSLRSITSELNTQLVLRPFKIKATAPLIMLWLPHQPFLIDSAWRRMKLINPIRESTLMLRPIPLVITSRNLRPVVMVDISLVSLNLSVLKALLINNVLLTIIRNGIKNAQLIL